MTKTTCDGTVDVPPYTRICPYPHDGKEKNEKKLNLEKSISRNSNVVEADVKNLKTVLHELGYYQPNIRSEGPSDFHGYPNQELDDAIRSFQRDHGLTADGAIKPDGETENEINAQINAKIAAEKNYSPVPQNQNDADDELVRSFISDVGNHEGNPTHAYADSKGFVTVGKGKLVKYREDMKNINMIDRVSKQSATDDLKMIEHDKVTAHAQELKNKYPSSDPNRPYNFTSDKYKAATNLDLADGEADRLIANHIKQDLASIRKTFKDFDTYPLGVKKVLMDMQYNHGGFSSFPIFSGHIKNKDWAKAARQCESGQISKKRNEWRVYNLLNS